MECPQRRVIAGVENLKEEDFEVDKIDEFSTDQTKERTTTLQSWKQHLISSTFFHKYLDQRLPATSQWNLEFCSKHNDVWLINYYIIF